MEDFISSNSSTPMSSVPVQFLVNVFSSHLSCTAIKPVLVGETLPNGACIPVPFGTTFRTSVVALVAHAGVRYGFFLYHVEMSPQFARAIIVNVLIAYILSVYSSIVP